MQVYGEAECGLGVDRDGVDTLVAADLALSLDGSGPAFDLSRNSARRFDPCGGPALANGPRVA